MKKEWLYALAFIGLMVSCTGAGQSGKDELRIIDVGRAMENQTGLKLSELGADVRFVPLETNDLSLVGANPSILLLKNQIAVVLRNRCLLFDKTTGKFICEVGHVGNDPQAYSSSRPTYSNVDESLYFLQGVAQLQKYDLEGKYHGKIKLPSVPFPPADFCFDDSVIVGHYTNILTGYISRSLLFFNEKGEEIDTVPGVLPALPERKMDDVDAFSILNKGNCAIGLVNYKDGRSSANVMGNSPLWKSEGKIRFKEGYNDTIYTLQDKQLVPSMVFSSGKWKSGIEARSYSESTGKVLLYGCIFETRDQVFFQCYENYIESFNGVYDRKKGTTRICAQEKGFVDDLAGFLPFHPRACSLQGEYGNIIEAADVLTWLEENPDMAGKERFEVLKKLTEDSNPVVAITIPY